MITLRGVIWTVEQGRYEGMGEPVITLHGVIWTVEQGRSEGMSEPVITLQGFFTEPSCEHLWAPVQGVGGGRPINGRWECAVMCVCVVF